MNNSKTRWRPYWQEYSRYLLTFLISGLTEWNRFPPMVNCIHEQSRSTANWFVTTIYNHDAYNDRYSIYVGMFPCTLGINSCTCQTSELTLNTERSSRSLDGDNLSSTKLHIYSYCFASTWKFMLSYYAVLISPALLSRILYHLIFTCIAHGKKYSVQISFLFFVINYVIIYLLIYSSIYIFRLYKSIYNN